MDAAEWDARYREAELLWTAAPNRFLVAQVADLPPGRVLDVAAGEGRNAVWLAERGWRATAVDFSSVALDKGRRLAAARGVEETVEWVHADVTAWTPPAEAFDLVVVLYLHVPADERRQVYRHAAGALAAGGTFLVVGHARDNLEGGVGGPQDPAILLDPQEVAADLAAVGLTVEVAEQVHRPVEVDGEERVAIDCLVRAGRG